MYTRRPETAEEGAVTGVIVGAVQFPAGTDKQANGKALRELVMEATADGAELVVGPEYAMYNDPDPKADMSEAAEELDGPFIGELREMARASGATVVAGMSERVVGDSRASNTVVAVTPSGEMIGAYRKLHLYDAFGWTESRHVRPGDHTDPLTFEVGGLRFGVMTCYDLRFPEMARVLADAGADAIVLPAAWVAGPCKEDHWDILVRARAIENTCYVVAAAQTPPGCSGHSMVVDPMGIPVAMTGEEPGAAVARISKERVESVRSKLPSLKHRRFSVVPAW